MTAITQECCEQYWTSPGGNTPQNISFAATHYPSRKLSNLDEPDVQDPAGKVKMNSWAIYARGTIHMDEQRQDDQQEPIYKQLCADTGYSLEELPGAMNDRDK